MLASLTFTAHHSFCMCTIVCKVCRHRLSISSLQGMFLVEACCSFLANEFYISIVFGLCMFIFLTLLLSESPISSNGFADIESASMAASFTAIIVAVYFAND